MFMHLVIKWLCCAVGGLPTAYTLTHGLELDTESLIMPLIAGMNSSIEGNNRNLIVRLSCGMQYKSASKLSLSVR